MMNEIQYPAFDLVCPCSINDMDQSRLEDVNNENNFVLISDNQTRERPLYEIKHANYLETIRRQLATQNRVLLPTYNTFAYYSCEKNEMDKSIERQMESTKAYRFVMQNNENTKSNVNQFFNEKHYYLANIINSLFQFHFINYTQWQQLIHHSSDSHYDQLYFLPNLHRNSVEFRPMILERHRLLMNIDRFLTNLLQPLYDHLTVQQTFYNGVDAIRAVQEYNEKGYLQTNTLFVHLYIPDVSTNIPYQTMYLTLERFLSENKYDQRLDGLTISTIVYLTKLCLEERYLLYDGYVYQQMKGGCYNSSLTMIVVNICLHYWQQPLISHLKQNNEIFGRYNDEMFFTWNKSRTSLQDIICSMNEQNISVPFRVCMRNSINYLDVSLSHNNGHLQTQINHDSNTEPYSLPFVYGLLKTSYSSLFQATLRRGVRCYASMFEFATEVQQLQRSFRYNKFSEQFISNEIQKFLNKFHVDDLKILEGEQFYNQELYQQLRHQVVKEYNGEINKKTKLKRLRKASNRQRCCNSKEVGHLISTVQSFFSRT